MKEPHSWQVIIVLAVSLVLSVCALPGCSRDAGNTPVSDQAAKPTLDELLLRLPLTQSWHELEHSSEAAAVLAVVLADPSLAAEVLERFDGVQQWQAETHPLMWLVSKLESGKKRIMLKLASKDSTFQDAALTLTARMHWVPEPQQFMALLSEREPVAGCAVSLAAWLHHTDPAFYIAAFNSKYPDVSRKALGLAPGPEALDALLPLVIEKIRALKTDEEVADAHHLFTFLGRYDRLRYLNLTLENRDDILKTHEEMQDIRLSY